MAESTDKQALEVVAWHFSWADGWDEFCKPGDLPSEWDETPTIEALVRLSDARAAIAQARQDEREACARGAENYDLGTPEGHAIATAIRARKD